MLYMIPTKKGMGVELWGTHNDLDALYSFIGKFWDSEVQHNPQYATAPKKNEFNRSA